MFVHVQNVLVLQKSHDLQHFFLLLTKHSLSGHSINIIPTISRITTGGVQSIIAGPVKENAETF